MLRYEQFQFWNLDFHAKEKAVMQYVSDELTKRQEKLKEKTSAIANLIYEKDLIEQDIINVIKEDLSYSGYNLFSYLKPEMLDYAWKYGNHMNDDEWWEGHSDKKEECIKFKEDCRHAFEYALEMIKKNILKNDSRYELFEVINYCFSTRYDFGYKIGDRKIWIGVPVFANASEKNYTAILQGYVVTYEEDEITLGQLTCGLDYIKVADELEAWVNNNAKF